MENYLARHDHLTYEDEKEEVKEELIENKVSFFNALQGLEATRKYMQQPDVQDNTLVKGIKLKTSSTH